MITYQSSRGSNKQYTFSEAILKGLADDGGLLVPTRLPHITTKQLEKLLDKPYQEIASFVLKLFEPDFSAESIASMVDQAYAVNFDSAKVAPVIHLKNHQYLLELWHGPTAAFKDMALQLMPVLFSDAIKAQNQILVKKGEKPLQYLILVATSGDTGKAALDGYKNKEHVSIMVFYPAGRVSQLQEKQMITQEGSNVAVYGYEGNFDHTQTMVKNLFDDRALNEELLKKNQVVLSSANSINWGRLVPQIVYYVSSYLSLVKEKVVPLGDKIDVCVPTGNFGNLLAAYYAKKMGLPINKLVCASNANSVVTEFLATGKYDIRDRRLVQTPSPSMDILIASNIERLLYEITQDPQKVSGWMRDLKMNRVFEIDDEYKVLLRTVFHSDYVSNEDCLSNIRQIYLQTNQLIDPHTSVAQLVAERFAQQTLKNRPMLICATAHWSKFAKDMYQAIIGTTISEDVDEFEILNRIKKIVPNAHIPESILELQNKPVRFRTKCGAQDIKQKLVEFARAGEGRSPSPIQD